MPRGTFPPSRPFGGDPNAAPIIPAYLSPAFQQKALGFVQASTRLLSDVARLVQPGSEDERGINAALKHLTKVRNSMTAKVGIVAGSK